jgi:hypothetical protein
MGQGNGIDCWRGSRGCWHDVRIRGDLLDLRAHGQYNAFAGVLFLGVYLIEAVYMQQQQHSTTQESGGGSEAIQYRAI